ncbi:S8 family serine peptidase [Lacinutrix neustonica]|uniref:S8 family serine peptidase n=1 Tax=Lacinutrix neustonica TaxID=2980107 RepID=A0A9E8MXW9_9FLAO|nr:S8 family serine peptidase [Lacinutrix neustonica]WAC03727.1 S8 family serine peptidase [Lacinutrix neustonica]
MDKELSIEDPLIDKSSWQNKDIIDDSIPGISLDKAYNTILKNKKNKTIVVAVLDSPIDLCNRDIANNVWINTKEIPNNAIDDDDNGYPDDIYGWNFLGDITHANYDYVRIVKRYQSIFENKTERDIKPKDLDVFNNYLKAKSKYDKENDLGRRKSLYAINIMKKDNEAKKALSPFVKNNIYTIEKLNELDTIGNGLHKHVEQVKSLLKYELTDQQLKQEFEKIQVDYNKRLNLNFNERTINGDTPDNINDIHYRNNTVSSNLDLYTHGTGVSGVIVEKHNDTILTNNIKIMPVCISPFGDEHDKDIALGIRYAVDNGAKVINMSFGKEFSLYPKWVHDALIYAEEHNVLIVSSCGNGWLNLNEVNDYYPNDNINNGKEVCDNFLLVGASSHLANENLKVSYSNYGTIDVDVFAPGGKIYTTYPNNEIKIDSGTSLAAALTSKVAALIFSYYPNLSASQVKHIIMDSV